MLSRSARRSFRALPKVFGRTERQIRTSALLEQAVPAVQTQASGGFLSGFLSSKPSASVPPLYDPLPGLTLPPPLEFPQNLTSEVSTLSNGMKIASEATPGPTATVGIYVDSGSVYESGRYSGCSHILERMAFKSTANRTHFRLVREIEAIGANVSAGASREQMAYTADAIKTYLPELVELLADSVRNPVFRDQEVKEQLGKVKAEIAEMGNHPQSLLLEALHTAGYDGALGRPLLCPESQLSRIDGQLLYEYVAENYTAPRMVLAAAGVEHEELKAIAEPLFGDLPSSPQPGNPLSKYVGGEWRAAADSPVTHVAMGFEFSGGWRNEKDSVAAIVLQTLLGGGGSFSAGGPGKGMYSRLYLQVLNEFGKVQSCTAFNSIYNNSGIIGIYAVAESDFTSQLVDIMTNQILSIAGGGVEEEELERAKRATISSVLMNLESRMVVAEDIGRQILTYGHRKAPKEFISAVEAVTVKDVTNLVKKLAGTPLTLAAYGDVVHVPRYDKIAARFV
eukprot:jgi/Mesen1/8516/ME000480S07866